MKERLPKILYIVGLVLIGVEFFDEIIFDNIQDMLKDRFEIVSIYHAITSFIGDSFFGFCLIGIARVIEATEEQSKIFTGLRKRKS
jgi:hypothetical protein